MTPGLALVGANEAREVAPFVTGVLSVARPAENATRRGGMQRRRLGDPLVAVGSIVGLLGTAVLAAVAGLSVALVVVGAVLLGWGLVLVATMPETGFERHNSSARARFRALIGDGFVAARRPGLRVLLIVTVMAGFASEAVDRLHVARLDRIGLQTASIDPALLVGAGAVMQSLGAIAVLWVFGSRLAGQRLVSALAALHIATAVGVAVLARIDVLTLALAGVIAQGMMRNVARTVTVGWTNHSTSRANRATVHSFTGQAGALGEISGGVFLACSRNDSGSRPP